MADKTPIRLVFTDGTPTGIAEYQSGDTIGTSFLPGSGAITFLDDSSTSSAITLGNTFKIAGGSGVTTSVSGDTITISTDGAVVTETSTDILTNKTINSDSNTLTLDLGEGTLTGTTAEFNTALQDGSFATLAGAETLTNKSLTSPTITGTGAIAGTFTGNITGDVTGNADTATALETARTIAGQSFDGTSNITIAATDLSDTNQSLSTTDNVTFNDLTVSGNLTVSGTTTTVNTETINLADNTITLNSNETGTPSQDGGIEIERGTSTNKTLIWNETTDKWTVGSETFVAGTFEGALTGNVTGDVTGNADTATSLETARTIGGVSFDGTANINLPGVNASGNQDTSGNAATATALETARTIAGQSFDGTGNITIASTDLSNTSNITLNDASQTLTNKTLTTPVISSISNTGTLTLPTSTDTLVGRDTTDTLTNKTIDTANNTITIVEADISDLGSYITASSTTTFTNKTFDANGTGNSISNIEVADLASGVLDTDLSSVAGTDTTLASAKAIKAYVDSQTASQMTTFTISDDSSTTSTITQSDTLQFLGGTGIGSTVSGDTVTFAIDNTVATLTGSQTLTNKTLTSPVIATISNTGTLTLPTSTDTLVGRATTDTLTNKTINSASNTITITESDISDLGAYITASSTDTLTNKTINASQLVDGSVTNAKLANSSVTIADDSSTTSTLALGETLQLLGGTGISSTVSGDSVTFAIDNTVTTNSGTQTLTNKTISGASNTLTNIGNSSLTNSTITVAGDSGSNAVDLGDTLTIQGTTNEVETSVSGDTITIGLPSDVTVSNNLTVSGNLTVNGTTTTVASTNTTVSDQLFELGNGRTGSATGDAGIVIERGDDNNVFLGYDESEDEVVFGTGTFTGSSTGDLSITNANIRAADVTATGALDVSGASTLRGDITLGVNSGDSTEDTITVNGRFVSNLEPLNNITYDLGSPNRRWKDLYLSGNTIDLAGATISGDGTGQILISATGATLPSGSKVGNDTISVADSNTGVAVRNVSFFTNVGGLSTAAATFKFAASASASVFTTNQTFLLSNGSNASGLALFDF